MLRKMVRTMLKEAEKRVYTEEVYCEFTDFNYTADSVEVIIDVQASDDHDEQFIFNVPSWFVVSHEDVDFMKGLINNIEKVRKEFYNSDNLREKVIEVLNAESCVKDLK